MAIFDGQLYKAEDVPPERAHVQIEDGRCRLFTPRRRLGSWDMADVKAERMGVLRFQVTAGDYKFFFQPADPRGFSNAIGASLDLTASKGRFGLADRIRSVNGQD